MSHKFYQTKFQLLEQLTGAMAEIEHVLGKLETLEKGTPGCDKDLVNCISEFQGMLENYSDYFIQETDAVEVLVSDFG